jgi:hypothetical protein
LGCVAFDPAIFLFPEDTMRFLCLGYIDRSEWDGVPQGKQQALMEECFRYDDELRRNGHWADGGGALQSASTAKTLRSRGGKLVVTDGPFAETKEQLGGLLVLEARDMDHAVELMSKHPGVRVGPFEIRPIDEEMSECGRSAVQLAARSAEGAKFVCLGYGDERVWSSMPENERSAMIKECAAYGEVLSQYGAWVGGDALQDSRTAKTLRHRGGKVIVTDGPYTETKEQLGGIAVFRFRDMQQAVEAWSEHPCLRVGDALELRPADEAINALIEARGTATERATQ